MLAFAAGKERVGVFLGGGGGSSVRSVRGGPMDVSALIQTQHGMI